MPKKAKTPAKSVKRPYKKRTVKKVEKEPEVVAQDSQSETPVAEETTDAVTASPLSASTPTPETPEETPVAPPVSTASVPVVPAVAAPEPPVSQTPLSASEPLAVPDAPAAPTQVISTTGQILPASTPDDAQTPPVQQSTINPSPTITPIPGNDSAAPSQASAPQSTFEIPQAPSSFQLDDSNEGGNKKNIFLMILLILIIAALIGIGFVYRTTILGMFAGKAEPTPTPTPAAAQQTPEPTEAPKEVTLDAHPISVLNGSGTAGEATKLKDILEEKGYKVDNVGNADTSDYENTVIQAKSSVSREFLDSLKKTLGESYKLDPVDTLSETEDVDIVVIIGQTEAE